MDVFNEVERERYWIDGVKPITALVWYTLAYDFAFAARVIAMLIRALPGIIEEGVLKADEDREELLRQLEDPAMVEELGSRYGEDEAFRAQFNAEVASILSPPPALPGTDAVPLIASPDPVVMGDQVRQRVMSSLFDIASKRAVEEGVNLVVFGHTHEASVEELPGDAVYINSGTWNWVEHFGGADKETWQDLFEHPERFTDDCLLSYVRVDYDDSGQPTGQLLAYRPGDQPPPPPLPPVRPSFLAVVLAWLRGLWGAITGGR
jgi:hypothetical protein